MKAPVLVPSMLLIEGVYAAEVTVEEIEKRLVWNVAIRRIVDAGEIAHVVAFLASPKSAAITGESISVAGGSDRAVFQRGS